MRPQLQRLLAAKASLLGTMTDVIKGLGKLPAWNRLTPPTKSLQGYVSDLRWIGIFDVHIAVLGTRGIPATYGGFETCAEQLSGRWAAAGHEVVAYARKYRYDPRPSVVNGVHVRYTSCLRWFGLETPSATVLAVLDLISGGRRSGWIHLYDTSNAFLLPLLRAMGFRVVISVDGIEWRRKKLRLPKKWAYKLGAYLAARFADRVVADNQVVANFYAQRYHCTAAMIAYGAQLIERSDDADEILSRFGLKASRYCVFVGRIVPEKNVQSSLMRTTARH